MKKKKAVMKKAGKIVLLTVIMLFAVVGVASANDGPVADTGTVSSIDNALKVVQLTALAALTAIAVVAITLFGGIYAWKYGKKVFKIIAS